MNLDSTQKTRLAIALGAVVALVLGFVVLNNSGSDSSADASAQTRGPAGQNGQMAPGGQGGPTGGGMGQGGPPGAGGPGQGGPGQMEEVTGTAATKAKAAAEDEVDGTAQRVMKNPQGSGYIVIVQGDDNSATIVEVNTKFKVTGTQELGQGGPGGGQGGPPPGGMQQDTGTAQQ